MNNSTNLTFVFIIFFLTLGPLKTIPVFYSLTHNATAKFRQSVALRSTLIATVIVLLLALVGHSILENWRVSIEALTIAGGLLLLIAALKILAQFSLPNLSAQNSPPPEETAQSIAISPIAIPGIITPYGIVAIVVSLANATGNRTLEIKIIGLLLLIMFLNWLGMTYAKQIIQRINLVTLLICGWVFAVLQAGLAIDVILNSLRSLKIIPLKFYEYPQPPTTGTTNELAKRRNRDAAERTLTAWIQNSLTLMGLGIALDQILMSLQKAFPNIDLMISQKVARELGLSLIAFSISLLMLAMWQYQIEVRSIEQDNYLFLSSRPLILAATTTIILFGIVAAIIIVFKSL